MWSRLFACRYPRTVSEEPAVRCVSAGANPGIPRTRERRRSELRDPNARPVPGRCSSTHRRRASTRLARHCRFATSSRRPCPSRYRRPGCELGARQRATRALRRKAWRRRCSAWQQRGPPRVSRRANNAAAGRHRVAPIDCRVRLEKSEVEIVASGSLRREWVERVSIDANPFAGMNAMSRKNWTLQSAAHAHQAPRPLPVGRFVPARMRTGDAV